MIKLITGSFAVWYYTKNRKYNDIDVAVLPSNLSKIAKQLSVEVSVCKDFENVEYKCIRKGIFEYSPFIFIQSGVRHNFGITSEVGDYEDIYVKNKKYKLIPAERLLVLKLFLNRNTGGKQDLQDAKNLASLKSLDWEKVYKYAKKHLVVEKCIELESEIQKIGSTNCTYLFR